MEQSEKGNAPPQQDRAQARPCVLIVVTQMEAGGAQEHAMQLLEHFQRDGINARLCFLYQKTAAFDGIDGVDVIAPCKPAGLAGYGRFLLQLVRYLRQLRPDVILSFSHYSNILAAVLRPLLPGTTVIASQTSLSSFIPPRARTIDRWLGMSGLIRRIIVNSAATERSFCHYPARYLARCQRIDLGVRKQASLTRSAARTLLQQRYGVPATGPLLMTCSRLSAEKSLHTVISALAELPDEVSLCLLGDGDQADALAAQARELGLAQRVFFAGEVAPDAVADQLIAADLFLAASTTESFGLSVVEAIRLGIPAVISDIETFAEVVSSDHGPAAELFAVGSASSCAGAVSRLLQHGPDAARQQAMAQVRERYGVERMYQQYRQLCLASPDAASSAPLRGEP